jgi:FSR family fosmidomycin resistance protein-like MFS transporter
VEAPTSDAEILMPDSAAPGARDEDASGTPIVGGIVVTPEVKSLARKRFGFLISTHAMIDLYPIFFVSLIVLLTDRLKLTDWQVATVFALTPIFSGSLQPFFAWFTDRFDTRICAPLGMFLGATCITSIGFAQNFWQLVALQIVGVIGTGMWHPVSAALAGQIGGRAFPRGRGVGLAFFFAAGMLGQAIGSRAAPNISTAFGMQHLAWLMIPGVIAAVALWIVLNRVPHRHDNHAHMHASLSREESRERWRAVITICVANCLLYTVNIGVFAMLSVWAKSKIDSVNEATRLHGALLSFATIGMGLAGLFATRIVPVGREKWPVVGFCIAGAICVGLFGVVGDWGLRMGGDSFLRFWPAYLWAILTAVGYFATMPVSMSLGQRLLPGRTGLVSSLLMGVGWAFSASAPFIAPLFLGGVSLKAAHTLPAWRIDLGFAGFSLLALLAGLLYSTIDKRVIARAAIE